MRRLDRLKRASAPRQSNCPQVRHWGGGIWNVPSGLSEVESRSAHDQYDLGLQESERSMDIAVLLRRVLYELLLHRLTDR